MKLLFDLLIKKGDDPDYDRRNIAWYNVVMLSISMLFVYSTIKTLINAMKVLVWQTQLHNPEFDITSDYAVGTSILLLTVFYVFAPWIVFKTEPRIWMLLFTVCLLVHIAMFFKPIKYVVYITSAVIGITAALSSTAQAHYISLNTFFSNVGKNSEVFWSILNGSMVVGNFFVFVVLVDHDNNEIPAKKHELFCYLLVVMATLGFIFVFFLGQQTVKSDEFSSIPWLLILKLIQLLMTKDMVLLVATFVYLGLQETFMNGIYSNAIGFTMVFSRATPLRNAAFTGVLVGAGTITAIVLLSLTKKYLMFRWHIKIYMFGIFLQILSYILIILNIPNEAVQIPTDKVGIGMSSYSAALFCAFLLGFGEYCMRVELNALLIEKYENQFTPATFLQIFVTKLSSGIAYFYGGTQLFIIVGILLGMAVVSTICFGAVEILVKQLSVDELDIPRTRTGRRDTLVGRENARRDTLARWDVIVSRRETLASIS